MIHLFYETMYKQLESLYVNIAEKARDLIEASDGSASCAGGGVKHIINQRIISNFQNIRNKYFRKEVLTPFHVGQYTMFLYFVANTLYKSHKNIVCSDVCSSIYGLSKIVSSADIYYEVELPSYFFFDHPVGSVIGRGNFGDFLCFSQGVTIGNNKGKYPSLGEFVILHSHSKVLGSCAIGSNVIISANTYLKDIDIPSNCIVFEYHDELYKKLPDKQGCELISSFAQGKSKDARPFLIKFLTEEQIDATFSSTFLTR